jgi:cellobiose phosphorylase
MAVYRGTVLEHLLVQHLTAFYNAGPSASLLLEGADWNDGMDMARRRGESVAFTALYASNLADLSRLVLDLRGAGVEDVALAIELLDLLDTLADPVDYADPAARQARLAAYFARCRHAITGEAVRVPLAALSADLAAKADWLASHIRSREWVFDAEGRGWFNGYYDDDGQPVEGAPPRGAGSAGCRMTLTGQVFTLLGGIATDEQAASIVRAADHYLYDEAVGGYRLNTDFGEVLLNLGRCFGFAYGHKENGAMFSHMAVMYASALYARGLPAEGWKVLSGIYRHCQDFSRAAMYPGLPEYVNPRGRGVYGWLTGSASWFLLTMLTQVYGVRGHLGDLLLAPTLAPEQYDARGDASVCAGFAGRALEIIYRNPGRLALAACQIEAVTIDGATCPFDRDGLTVRISRATVVALSEGVRHQLVVSFGPGFTENPALPD